MGKRSSDGGYGAIPFVIIADFAVAAVVVVFAGAFVAEWGTPHRITSGRFNALRFAFAGIIAVRDKGSAALGDIGGPNRSSSSSFFTIAHAQLNLITVTNSGGEEEGAE